MQSIFMEKATEPNKQMLEIAIGSTLDLWKQLYEHTLSAYPAATAGWHFSGAKHGWSYRISDKKRVIVYLLPRDGFFEAAIVLGDAACMQAMASNIAPEIKAAIGAAKPYAEGRGIRVEITKMPVAEDIARLIDIKLAN